VTDERDDDQPMTIGEHLDELRSHVLKALLWIVVALAVCLTFQQRLMLIAKIPHQSMVDAITEDVRTREAELKLDAARVEAALEASKRDDALGKALEDAERARLIARERARPTTPEALAELERRQRAALADIERLRAALDGADTKDVPALEAALTKAASDAAALRAEVARDVRPLLDHRAQAPSAALMSTSPTDVFMTYMKLALVASLFLAAPLIVWELWKFVGRALYPHEKRWVKLFGPLTYLCFLAGFLFGYLILVPIGLRFLASYAPAEVAFVQYSIQEYVSTLITLSLVCGIIFELPLVLTFLALIGVVDAQKLREVRRYWVLAAFVIAGILTPPDPFTQTLMAIPLLGLYELGIVLAALVGKKEHAAPPPALVAPAVNINDAPPLVPPTYAPEPPPATPTLGLEPRPLPEGTIAAGLAENDPPREGNLPA
jgi:Tat protein translocase TatC